MIKATFSSSNLYIQPVRPGHMGIKEEKSENFSEKTKVVANRRPRCRMQPKPRASHEKKVDDEEYRNSRAGRWGGGW